MSPQLPARSYSSTARHWLQSQKGAYCFWKIRLPFFLTQKYSAAQKCQTTFKSFPVTFLLLRTGISICRTNSSGGSRSSADEAPEQRVRQNQPGKRSGLGSAGFGFSCYKHLLCSTTFYVLLVALQVNQSNRDLCLSLTYILLQQKAEIFNQINCTRDFIKCEALSFVMQLKAFWLRLVGFKKNKPAPWL